MLTGQGKNTATASPTSTTQPYSSYRFNAMRWDGTSGQYDMGFRNYDPGFNQFASRDMYNGATADMGLATDPFTGSQYAFGNGNPISNIENDGHMACAGPGTSDCSVQGGPQMAAKPYYPPTAASGQNQATGSSGCVEYRLAGGPCTATGPGSGGGAWDSAIANLLGGILNAFYGKPTPTPWSKYLPQPPSRIPLGNPNSALYKIGYYGAGFLGFLGSDGDSAPGDPVDDPFGDPVPAKGSPVGCGQSFTPDTQVLLASGKTAPISKLRPGDKVLATNTKTGKTQAETVTAVEVRHDTDLYNLTVKTPHGTAIIHTTSNHLFWDPYQHQWITSNKLSKGEHLQAPDGQVVTADGGTTPKQHDGWMWDLTIPGNNDHDFYVIAGNLGQPVGGHPPDGVVAGGTAVLVHNAGCWTATDATLDNIHDTYGPRVEQGVEWMMNRYNQGATGHALNGIGTDAEATARYLAQARTWSYIDSTSGNWVTYDSSNQILIIRTTQDIHAYNYTSQQWATNVGVRYVSPAAGVQPPAWP